MSNPLTDADPAVGEEPPSTAQGRAAGSPRRGLPAFSFSGVRPGRDQWRGAAAIVGGTAAILVHAAYYGRWLIDDAAVTFAYARSISTGHGFALQAGAPAIEAYSNPTWLSLLILGRFAGLFDHGSILGLPDYVVYPKALAALCCLGILAGVHSIAKRISRRPSLLTFAVGATLALIPSFVIWCFSGLENSLYGLLVIWIVALMIRRAGELHTSPKTAACIGLLAGLAALTRPDGVIYALACPLMLAVVVDRTRLKASIRTCVASFIGVAVVYLPYLLFRIVEFGKLVPNTAVAKAQSIPVPTDLSRVDDLVHYAGPVAIAFLVVCACRVMITAPDFRAQIAPALVVLGLAVTAYCVLNEDWMPQLRFATPVWVVGCLVGWLCVERTFRDVGLVGRGWVVALAVLSLSLSTTSFVKDAQTFKADPTTQLCRVADRYGRVINGYGAILQLPADSTLLLPDVGGTALTSNYRILDLAGLANKQIAEFQNTQNIAGLDNYIFNVLKPTIIHYHSGWRDGIPGDPELTQDYYLVYTADGASDDGDWVRKSDVKNLSLLTQARSYAKSEIDAYTKLFAADPTRSCGDVLDVGSLP